jgi:predicted RNA-binding Zn-ribbon protein involved in translation (DUF1610 family)
MTEELPSDWRDWPLRNVINKFKIFPCASCGEIIYRLKKGIYLEYNRMIRAEDFEGMPGIPSPKATEKVKCPKCGKPLAVVLKRIDGN